MYERAKILAKNGLMAAEVSQLAAGTKAVIEGNPIRLRFPPTKSGKRVVFFDLEDESGLANVTCFDDTYMKYGHAPIRDHPWRSAGPGRTYCVPRSFGLYLYRPSFTDELPLDTELPIKRGDYLVG